ncbi:hypothetical protein ACFLVG_03530 [Chloroflexota bacterium]
MTTEMNPKPLRPPSKPDRGGYLKKVARITSGDKTNILRTYERGLRQRKRSEEVLEELAEKYNRSTRTIQRYIALTKEDRERARHIKGGNTDSVSLLEEAKKEHFMQIRQLIIQWKHQLVYDVTTSHVTYEATFPTSFKCTDVKADMGPFNHHSKASIVWYFNKEGEVTVWFSIEDIPLFRCLCPHLPNKKLWRSFEELKTRIAQSIKEAASTRKGKKISVHGALSLASEVADELQIASAKRIFVGKCDACPDN